MPPGRPDPQQAHGERHSTSASPLPLIKSCYGAATGQWGPPRVPTMTQQVEDEARVTTHGQPQPRHYKDSHIIHNQKSSVSGCGGQDSPPPNVNTDPQLFFFIRNKSFLGLKVGSWRGLARVRQVRGLAQVTPSTYALPGWRKPPRQPCLSRASACCDPEGGEARLRKCGRRLLL